MICFVGEGLKIESDVLKILSSCLRDAHAGIRLFAIECLLNWLANAGADSERLRLTLLRDSGLVNGL